MWLLECLSNTSCAKLWPAVLGNMACIGRELVRDHKSCHRRDSHSRQRPCARDCLSGGCHRPRTKNNCEGNLRFFTDGRIYRGWTCLSKLSRTHCKAPLTYRSWVSASRPCVSRNWMMIRIARRSCSTPSSSLLDIFYPLVLGHVAVTPTAILAMS